ncbi:MAG: SsrA-binding protein SmpB [Deltaproteobacteria bacterium]|nr:SsrA-binding protein SmpB [Deltaproteobacteria bacterium]
MTPKRETVAILNRKAKFHYHLLEFFEAGMVLTGSEVKSLRAGRANLGDAYAIFRRDALWLLHCHISLYPPAAANNHEPLRSRKLLLHARELARLIGKMKERGLTVIPTKLYFTPRGLAKCELALARGKAQHDKRETTKKREAERAMRRAMKR